MAIYPEALQEIKEACTRYRQHSSNLADLQAALWKATETVVAVEERELRDFLQQAEGELEMVRFTADQGAVFAESLNTVSRIEQEIGRW